MSDRSSKHGIPASRVSRPAVGLRSRTAAVLPADRATARIIALTEADAASVTTVMAALPDPATLTPGALVVVPAALAGKSLARSVLSMLGRPKRVATSRRCSALVARGYIQVGAAEDGDDDLAWGYAP